MQTLAAYYESIDPAGVLTLITAVPDEHVFVTGDLIRVPEGMPNLIGQAGLLNDASAARAQVQSPSLRMIANVDVEPLVAAAVFGSPPEVLFHPLNPIPLAPGEGLEFAVESDPAAAADHYGLVWLADGPQQAVTGSIYTVRAVGQNVGAAGAWTNMGLTWDQVLPVGRYQVVGLRARAVTGVACRLVFVGGIWRPGVPCVNAIADTDVGLFRYGRSGVMGEFHTNQPPTVEVLGPAGGVPVFLFDLIRVG